MPSPLHRVDPFDDYFTNRREEIEAFRRDLRATRGEEVTPFAYHGVTGTGKSWLLRRLRQIAEEENGIKTVTVDLDPAKSGGRVPDRAKLVAAMIAQFEMEAPRTTFALVHLSAQERDPLFNRGELAQELLTQGLGSFADAFLQNFQSFGIGGFVGAGVKTALDLKKKLEEPLRQYLTTPEGRKDQERLKFQRDSTAIRGELFTRFGWDLVHEPNPERRDVAVQNVLFVDSVEQAFEIRANEADEEDAVAWMAELWRECCLQEGERDVPLLLVVPLGQNAVAWPAPWKGVCEARALEGFLKADAEEYLRERRGVRDEDEVARLLDEAREGEPGDGPPRHHVLSLGLAADIRTLEEREAGARAVEERREGESSVEFLIRKFFRRVTREEKVRIERLAVTPSWDRAAFEHVYRVGDDPDRAKAEWERFSGFSFVRRGIGGDFSLHDVMRDVAKAGLAAGERAGYEAGWRDYWRGRMGSPTDAAGRRYWGHAFALDPMGTLNKWQEARKLIREGLRSWDDQALVAILAEYVQSRVCEDEETAKLYGTLGNALGELALGDRAGNIRQAIAALRKALMVFTCEAFPSEWAATQSNLGVALTERPDGNRIENLEEAVAAFREALTVYTREKLPLDWAKTQSNLGVAFTEIPGANREAYLRAAIEIYVNVLKVLPRKEFPLDWAAVQNNLGNALKNSFDGDRKANLRGAIAAYRAAMEEYTREVSPREWAQLQNNFGAALTEYHDGDCAEDLQEAVSAFREALKVFNCETFPLGWATVQNNLGNALKKRPDGDRTSNLQEAVAAFREALTVRTSEDFPWDRAEILFNLGMALGKQEKIEEADAVLEEALRLAEKVKHVALAESAREVLNSQRN